MLPSALCPWLASVLAVLALLTLVSSALVAGPCSGLASAQASFYTEYPEATSASISATLVYECISDIPLQKEFSLQLVDQIRPWLEIESQIDYLKYPAPGYLWDPIDIFEELDGIYNHIQNDDYTRQYDVEIDLRTLFLYFRDFHTFFTGVLSFEATGALAWRRQVSLVSISVDGIDIPKVYVSTDLVGINDEQNVQVSSLPSDSISAVASINGISVQEFLQTQQLVDHSHDPDAMYNGLFATWVRTSQTFTKPLFYPGPETGLVFDNGSVLAGISRTNLAQISCQVGDITTGQDYWDVCIAANPQPLERRSLALNKLTERQGSEEALPEPVLKVPLYPEPVDIDRVGELSGYFLEGAGYEAVAVLVIKSFDGGYATYTSSFQDTLESFISNALFANKTHLIIDVQGIGGGIIDLAIETAAQLFPNVPPNVKENFRASLGFGLMLKHAGDMLALENDKDQNDIDYVLENEQEAFYAWQSLMSPEASKFDAFDDFYGPHELKDYGNFTSFFQNNYTNSNPSDFREQGFHITGYGARPVPPGTPPPFDPANIVLLTDGSCGSACTIVYELLTNDHSIPAITVGGRPQTGPMQAVGNTKGPQVFDSDVLIEFLTKYLRDEDPIIDYSLVQNTVFEQWTSEAVGVLPVLSLNGRNGYRIGDESETPLSQVYATADYKIWYTPEMLIDPTAIWKRAAQIAFDPSREHMGAAGGPYTSPYCVEGSTGHSTSVTGGLERGSLGDQNPPDSAYPQYLGWLENGTEIVQGFSLVHKDFSGEVAIEGSGKAGKGKGKGTGKGKDKDSGGSTDKNSIEDSARGDGGFNLTTAEVQAGLAELRSLCSGYIGHKWFFTLICNRLGR